MKDLNQTRINDVIGVIIILLILITFGLIIIDPTFNFESRDTNSEVSSELEQSDIDSEATVSEITSESSLSTDSSVRDSIASQIEAEESSAVTNESAIQVESDIKLDGPKFEFKTSLGTMIHTTVINPRDIDFQQLGISQNYSFISIDEAIATSGGSYLLLSCSEQLLGESDSLLLKVNNDLSVNWVQQGTFESLIVLEDGSPVVYDEKSIYFLDSSSGEVINTIETDRSIDELFYTNGILTAQIIDYSGNNALYPSSIVQIDPESGNQTILKSFDNSNSFNDMYSIDNDTYVILSKHNKLEIIDHSGNIKFETINDGFDFPVSNWEEILPSPHNPEEFVLRGTYGIQQWNSSGQLVWSYEDNHYYHGTTSDDNYLVWNFDEISILDEQGNITPLTAFMSYNIFIDSLSYHSDFGVLKLDINKESVTFKSVLGSDVTLDPQEYLVFFTIV